MIERSPIEIEVCLDILVKGCGIRLAEDRYERTERIRPDDLCSYNVFSVARKDYARLKELLREFYRGARALIAASEPTEVAGLLVVQLGCWDPAG